MNAGENAVDPAGKEIREFDPAILDEEKIQTAQGAEPTVLEQEQRDEKFEQAPGHRDSWHTFITP